VEEDGVVKEVVVISVYHAIIRISPIEKGASQKVIILENINTLCLFPYFLLILILVTTKMH